MENQNLFSSLFPFLVPMESAKKNASVSDVFNYKQDLMIVRYER